MHNIDSFENSESIAIIGMAGCFPGAGNCEELWSNLCLGIESITFFSESDLDPSIDNAILTHPDYVKARGTIDEVDKFDASFFKISPREAQMMDPQHRIFLEVAYQALENAGYAAHNYEGLIGVFGGTGFNTYFANNVAPNRNAMNIFGRHQTYIANGPDYLSTRVSYKLNLKGPSISLYTGCSLSLVAVCLAYDSLLNYNCDMALAGGINIECPQNSGYLYHEGEITSKDGHCRPFDARANGTVFSNGGGIVVLKRVQDALKDGDHIYAVIKGAGMNNDGSKKVSYTAPSVDGQAEVISMAHADAEIDPESISYVETHGTGTPVGDPIEIAALSKAFQTKTASKNHCAIGSIKANIGHLDAAAGVAGLIKTALMLYHKKIPPNINFQEINPAIDIANSPFYVNTDLMDWKNDKIPVRRAAVSSFGVGGTNAHVVLEEAPERRKSSDSRLTQLILASAKSPDSLAMMLKNLSTYFKDHPGLNLPDVAFTLQTGRSHLDYRIAVTCENINDAILGLENPATRKIKKVPVENSDRDVVFMFSGQGSQYPDMGLDLYKSEPVFAQSLDQCLEILGYYTSLDVRSMLYPGIDAPSTNDTETSSQLLNQTRITQPVLFSIEYALSKLWMSWGISPYALVGHSIGEYVAGCLSGVFTLEDALFIVAKRAEIMQEQPRGAMLAVFLSEDEIQGYLNDKISLAVINSPSICVLSGEEQAVEELMITLSSKEITHRRLYTTSHAFHSYMMDPVLEPFSEKLRKIKLHPPKIPFVSNLTGNWISDFQATDPDYWVKQLRSPVRFSDCIEVLAQNPNAVFLEVGPGNTLANLTKLHASIKENQGAFSSLHHPNDAKPDLTFILNTLGQLWQNGKNIDWRGFYGNEIRQKCPLPAYPFSGKSHWIFPPESGAAQASALCDSKTQNTEVKPAAYEIDHARSIERPAAIEADLESKLTDIWENVLGVEDIRLDDDFFDLGGSSLMAVQVFIHIEKIFSRKLPVSILYKAPTISKLSDVIRTVDRASNWSSLVEIQPAGTRSPLFLIHGAGGNVLIYRDLAHRLGNDQPVYGLQSQGLDGKTPFIKTVEAMAAHYITEIKTIQPKGPYMLGGYCMGGSVALEMAQQLAMQNEAVSFLALLETYNFSGIPVLSLMDNLYMNMQKVEFHLRNFGLLNNQDRLIFLKEKISVARDRKKVWMGNLQSKINSLFQNPNGHGYSLLSDLWESNDLAALSYTPKLYKGPVSHFLPLKEYAHHLGPGLDIREVLEGPVETHRMKVFPAGMLVEPFVGHLADIIQSCIAACMPHTTTPSHTKTVSQIYC